MTAKRVLIVDDALELGRMLRYALESLEADLDVRVVPSAEEAILEASRQPVDLIVVDFRLPGMTGLELIEKVRAKAKDTRFILITGMSDESIVETARNLKADRFMPKPLQISEFLEVASGLLDIQVSSDGPLPVAVPSKPEQDSTAGAQDLASVLTRLRQELGAQATLLVNDRGQIIAQAGNLEETDFEGAWGPAIVASVNTTARLSRLLKSSSPVSAQVIRGDSASLIFAPVGIYAMLVFLKAERSELRSALAVEETLNAQMELSKILDQSGAPYKMIAESVLENSHTDLQSSGPVQTLPPVEEPSLGEFDTKLKGNVRKLDKAQADNFWEETDSAPFLSEDPDVITYDQARKLGLTPEDEERA